MAELTLASVKKAIMANVYSKWSKLSHTFLIKILPVSNHWLLAVLASQINRFADLSVITANRSPSLTDRKHSE